MDLKDWTDVIQNVAVAGAAVAGGVWAIYKFRLEREFETALGIELATRSSPVGDRHLLSVDVALSNIGKRKIEAQRERVGEFTYTEKGKDAEKFQHSCTLQVKRLHQSAADRARYLDWYGDASILSTPNGIPDIDLATEYEDPATQETDFWIEPGETAHLGTHLMLDPGHYFLKVTFIGTGDSDYWSRILAVEVPSSSEWVSADSREPSHQPKGTT